MKTSALILGAALLFIPVAASVQHTVLEIFLSRPGERPYVNESELGATPWLLVRRTMKAGPVQSCVHRLSLGKEAYGQDPKQWTLVEEPAKSGCYKKCVVTYLNDERRKKYEMVVTGGKLRRVDGKSD